MSEEKIITELFGVMLVLAGLGLVWSGYFLYWRRRLAKSQVQGHAGDVLRSDFLGLPAELLLLICYLSLAVAAGVGLWSGYWWSSSWSLTVLGLTALAVVVSIYWALIQLTVGRRYYRLIMISVVLSTVMLALQLWTVPAGVHDLLVELEAVWLAGLGLSLAVGVGSTTLGVVLFLNFLSDQRVESDEYVVLKVIGQISWSALAIVLMISAIWNWFIVPTEVEQAVVLSVLSLALVTALVETVMNFWIWPWLRPASLSQSVDIRLIPESIRRGGYALGAVSVISWFAMMTLVLFSDTDLDLNILLIIYGVVVLIAVALSQLVEQYLIKNTDE